METLFSIDVTKEMILKNLTINDAFELIKAIENDVCDLDFTIKIRDYCDKIMESEE